MSPKRSTNSGIFATIGLWVVLALLASGVAAVGVAPSASAWSAGDTYPYRSAKDCAKQFGTYSWCVDENKNGGYSSDEQYSKYLFSYRNCTDFVAYMLNKYNGVGFTNNYGGRQWGNAKTWDDAARAIGLAVNSTPAHGAVAQTDAGTWGHVAYVIGFNSTTVTVAEYNHAGTGAYGTRSVARSAFRYIHIEDLAGPKFTAQSPAAALKVGSAYSYTFKASGRPAPTFSRASGTLPAGLSLAANGKLSGTPTSAGVYKFSVAAKNVVGTATTSTKTVTINVAPTFVAASPQNGKDGVEYRYAFGASGSPQPSFELAAGALPDGLSLGSDGVLSGTPTTPGTSVFAVRATNSAGVATTPSIALTIDAATIAPTFTSAAPPSGRQDETYAYSFEASGNPPPTFAVTFGSLPAGLTLSSDGMLSGIPTTPGTAEFEVSATNSVGVATTGTLAVTIDEPDVTGPQLLISSPVADETVDVPFTVGGTVIDPAGVASVSVSFTDDATGQWLQPDGSLASSPAVFAATLSNPSETTTAWSTGTLTGPDGSYHAHVSATDTADNTSTVTLAFIAFRQSTPPLVPTDVTALSGENSKTTVSWTTPGDGGSPITGFEVERADNLEIRTTAATTVDWAGLTNGDSYEFRVRACNDRGCGDWSSSATAEPYTTPGTVAKPSVTSQNNAIRLAWAAPADGGSAIVRYEVTGAKALSTTASSVTITFGQDGNQKTFQVRACNVAGCGERSAVSSAARAKVIVVAKGAKYAGTAYWYDTKAYGNPGASMTLVCQDGTSLNWYSQKVTLDSTGYYRDATLCWSGDKNPHWVTSGTLTSNKVNF